LGLGRLNIQFWNNFWIPLLFYKNTMLIFLLKFKSNPSLDWKTESQNFI